MTDVHDGSGRLFPVGSGASRGARRTGRRALADGAAINWQNGLPLAVRDGMPVAPVDAAHLARQRQLKRLFLDIPLALLALLALSPLLLIVAAIVKLTSPGPVMFRQPRVGLHGVEFDILKFRSMRLDATDLSGVRQTAPEDERVTAVGRFLRATSIDELPQLWNILKGDMSVIGPRPMVKGQLAAGSNYRQVVPYYDYRHMVRPGLSGWAQANGLRGPTTDAVSARQRIDHDCAYVQNVSLALDLRIILQTIHREFLTGSGL
jgi:lipopolysaccharide/colanic/teichoic acid biosynthesis glycosyltransferase